MGHSESLVLLHQLSYAIKTQLKAPKVPSKCPSTPITYNRSFLCKVHGSFACLELCLYDFMRVDHSDYCPTNLALEHPGVRHLGGLQPEAPGVVVLTVEGGEPEQKGSHFTW